MGSYFPMTSLMAVSVLAGCGGDSDPERKGGEAASGKTEIVIWTRDSTVAAVKSAAKNIMNRMKMWR